MLNPAILTAFAGACALPFLFWLRADRRFGLPVTVRTDPDDPKPADFRDYLLEITRRLDAKPVKMRIRFFMANVHAHRATLDLDADGRLVVAVEGHRPAYADIGRRWIADHPIPFTFAAGRRPVILYVTPVNAGRFRVSDRLPFRIPLAVYAGISLLTTIAVLLALDALLAAGIGALAGSLAVGWKDGTGR